jgi:5-formyltetrahydrofolate cyclo-ligase
VRTPSAPPIREARNKKQEQETKEKSEFAPASYEPNALKCREEVWRHNKRNPAGGMGQTAALESIG